MIKALSVVAILALSSQANASVQAGGRVTVESMIVRNAAVNVVNLVEAPGRTYTTAQTSEILYGPDTASGTTNSYRTTLETLCSSSLAIPGADMGATSCIAGPAGVWEGSSWSNAAPSAVGSGISTQWYAVLQPGESVTFSGTVSVYARSQGVSVPPDSPVGQYAYANAHFFYVPIGLGLTGTSLSVSAGPTIAQDSLSERFSESFTNIYDVPLNAYFEVVITTSGLNAVVSVPEPSSWLMWLAALVILATWQRQRSEALLPS